MSSNRPGPGIGHALGSRRRNGICHPGSEESMNNIKPLNYALLCTAAIGALTLARPAAAQTDTQIQSIEQQIKTLQGQLGQVKADLATRDRALKAAQQQAKAAQEQAAAAQAQAAHAAATVPAQVAAATAAARGACRTAAEAGAVPRRRSDRHAGRLRGARRHRPFAQYGVEHRHRLRQHSVRQQPELPHARISRDGAAKPLLAADRRADRRPPEADRLFWKPTS